MLSLARELPPTAGMPLLLKDISFALFSNSSLPEDRSFETMMADYLQVEELDVYSSATLCLSLAFEAIKETTGRSKVIVPAYTCPLLAIAAYKAGLELGICDTVVNGFDLDPSHLEKLCDKSTAAVVPTAIAGLPPELESTLAIARAAGAFVIEDAAQALGAKRNGKPLGCDADLTVFSLAVGKGLSLYDGGLISTKDPALREQIRKVAKRRISANLILSLQRLLETLALALCYNPEALYFLYGQPLRRNLEKGKLEEAVGDVFELELPAYPFDSFRKRMGVSALERLPEFLRQNRQRGLERSRLIEERSLGANGGKLKVLTESPAAEGSWPFLMLLAESEERRDAILSRLWKSGLGVTRLFINSLANYEYLMHLLPQAQAATPNADSFAKRSFSISNSHFLEESDFEKILAGLF